jgi:hypothetical protein
MNNITMHQSRFYTILILTSLICFLAGSSVSVLTSLNRHKMITKEQSDFKKYVDSKIVERDSLIIRYKNEIEQLILANKELILINQGLITNQRK